MKKGKILYTGKGMMVHMDDLTKMLNRISREHSNSCREKEYECPECEDTGFIINIDENGCEIAVKCKCYDIRRAKEISRQNGISEEFRKKTFDNFEIRNIELLKNARNKAEQYAINFGRFEKEKYNSIMFSGQAGSGKTHLGMAICNNLLNVCGVGFIYMSYRNAITEIKQTVTDKENYYASIGPYCNARLLYIDDLLKGRSTEADLNILYELVNYRYMHNKPMIISTEKSPEELIEFDEAVGSRIIEMCRGNLILLRGKELNYRLYS